MLRIREAKEEDAISLVEIYRPYVEKTTVSFEYTVPTVAEFAGRIRAFSAFYPYFVAEEDGEILGYAYAHRYAERKAYDWVCETSVYVKESARGKGVGRALYGKLLPALRDMGIVQVLAILATPNEPSFRFHKAMGFGEGVELQNMGWKLGGWHGTQTMTLFLREAKESPTPVISFHELA